MVLWLIKEEGGGGPVLRNRAAQRESESEESGTRSLD